MGALDGIRVLDLTIVVQGPMATALLHDLGAEVVKVELPAIGDLARYIGNGPGDPRSPYFEACNRGKRSVTLDVRTDGGRRAMQTLVAWADVLVSNFRPGTMDEWGLSYDDCRAVNEGIIYATGSTFGPVGPDAPREGADLSGQAAGGMISTTGLDDGDYTPVGATVADATSSLTMACGILAALLHRQRTGVGQRVDVSLLGGQIWAQANEYTSLLLTGRVPGRSNRGHPLLPSLYGIFPTADGWIALVGCPAPLWPGFCRAIERPDLAGDPRFTGLIIEDESARILFEIVGNILPQRTTAEWCQRLATERQRFAPVRTYDEVVADPQAHQNGYFVQVPDRHGNTVTVVGSPIRLSATPATPGASTPELGEHTEEVLLEVGMTWEEIAAARSDGAY